ncbi:LacI family DNA-binding transcriptional regulator [Arthrobacter sp. 4R501]|uniref:LacI family DNA-binding transcriptional regulator n=1 Tax=Arthrobacter sp. 4R501 TaxID=2058886 RepID=UPI000CE3278C|nr:LacI family DNA-binding transcriptional regulator [Arthrobacter sp. 4R501]
MTARTGKAKMKDVAEAAGVSISTVSRVFSNPELLSPQTVRNVKDVASTLRFSPNLLARALITGTSTNIGLVVSDISNPYMTTLLKAAQAWSRSRDTGVFVADTDDSAVIEREVCEQLARQCRGIILCGPRMSGPHIREISKIIPLVLVNRVITGIPSIYTDSAPAMAELVDQLADLGHRKIAYLPGPAGSWANKQRARAVETRAAIRAIEVVFLEPTTAKYSEGIEAAKAASESGATAVMAFDDVLASGLIEGFRRLGLSVPDDISVTGHDDVLAELAHPGLTTVTGQSDVVGRLAVDRLLEVPNANGELDARATVVPAHIVQRASVSKPPPTHR